MRIKYVSRSDTVWVWHSCERYYKIERTGKDAELTEFEVIHFQSKISCNIENCFGSFGLDRILKSDSGGPRWVPNINGAFIITVVLFVM